MSWWSCRSCLLETGGTGTHKPRVGQDRDGASRQAPTRSLPPAVRAQGVSRPADGSLTGQPQGAGRSFGSGRAGERHHPTSLPPPGTPTGQGYLPSQRVTPPRLDWRRAIVVVGCLISGECIWARLLHLQWLAVVPREVVGSGTADRGFPPSAVCLL